MPPVDTAACGRTHWRSLDDLAGTPELRALAERELPPYAGELPVAPSRRDFLKVMGASLAFAGLTACRWPAEEILPFARRPEGYVPGVPESFATAMELAGVATGLLVTSYDGRPIKIEGNPAHPFSLGGTDALAQASLLDLYDLDRSRDVLRFDRSRGGTAAARTWDDFVEFAALHFFHLREKEGDGFRVLSEASGSPTLEDLRRRLLLGYPRASWHEYEPFSRDRERAGLALLFGKVYRPLLALDRARVIVSLDDDLLLDHPAAVRSARDFAGGRRADDGRMNRLYVVESAYSVTGSVADGRLASPSGAIPGVALALAAELFLGRGVALPREAEALRPLLEGIGAGPRGEPLVEAMARDLADAEGACVVTAGPRQPAEIHALAHLLNLALGAVGRTVRFAADPAPERPSHAESIGALAAEIAAGRVGTLLVLGGNPAFDAPADLQFAKLLARVGTVLRLGHHADETSDACDWHVPRAHYLESWGDARAWDGTLSVVQPLIEPLWGGRTPVEILALAMGDRQPRGYDLVRRTFRTMHGDAEFEERWRRTLREGLLAGTAWPEESPALRPVTWTERLAALLSPASAPGGGTVEAVFVRDAKVHDGRFANNGWLQELPDPLTKLTWDNAAVVAPRTAQDLGVSRGDVVRLAADGRDVEVPVFVLPGQAEGSITLHPGYGRRRGGRVAEGTGFDVYPLRRSDAIDAIRVRVVPAGRTHLLATTQDHHALDPLAVSETRARARELVREVPLDEYLQNPRFAREGTAGGEATQLWRSPQNHEGHRWGMAIDLSACIGCGACVVACQVENNVPVVGKAEVARGREMHWIRIDRYFSGEADAPGVAHQPVACQHCETAPCEQVCPVAATQHDGEGLNVMVYNRCVGTRYCSNNCPYKVRRFNWFNNHRAPTDVEKMVYNPEVTVRSRGVMEKCTFCTQRIEAVKIAAKNEGRPIRDGEIVPACAQACPTRAIVFGDLNDRSSRVRSLHESPRAYGLLGELNTRPRNLYLARLRNPGTPGGTRTKEPAR